MSASKSQPSFASRRLTAIAQVLTVLAIVAGFGINIWSNVAPPTGQTIGDISNTTFADVLVTPANYAFAIWGLIYLGLFALAGYQALPAQRWNGSLQAVRWGLIVASAAQVAWIFLFQYGQYGLSTIAMLAILVALVVAYRAARSPARRPLRLQRWFVCIPLSLYLGWISMATILNVAIALTAAGWDGGLLGPVVWTQGMAAVAALLAGGMAWRYRDAAFGGVGVWALAAIAVRHADRPAIAGPAGGLAIALGAVVFWRVFLQPPANSLGGPVR